MDRPKELRYEKLTASDNKNLESMINDWTCWHLYADVQYISFQDEATYEDREDVNSGTLTISELTWFKVAHIFYKE